MGKNSTSMYLITYTIFLHYLVFVIIILFSVTYSVHSIWHLAACFCTWTPILSYAFNCVQSTNICLRTALDRWISYYHFPANEDIDLILEIHIFCWSVLCILCSLKCVLTTLPYNLLLFCYIYLTPVIYENTIIHLLNT